MPYMVLDGLEVRVDREGRRDTESVIGDVAENIDGGIISSRRGEKARIRRRSLPLLREGFDALLAKLRSPVPVQLSGDIVATPIDVLPRIHEIEEVTFSARAWPGGAPTKGVHYMASFELREV